jgi:hypothetical protein
MCSTRAKVRTDVSVDTGKHVHHENHSWKLIRNDPCKHCNNKNNNIFNLRYLLSPVDTVQDVSIYETEGKFWVSELKDFIELKYKSRGYAHFYKRKPSVRFFRKMRSALRSRLHNRY